MGKRRFLYRHPSLRIILLATALLLTAQQSAFSAVSINGKSDRTHLSGEFSFLDDKSGTLEFREVLEASPTSAFSRLEGTLGRGYTNAASWLRLDVVNATATAQSRVLRLSPQMLDRVDIYIANQAEASHPSHFKLFRLGDHIAATGKQQAFAVMGVPLNLPAGESRSIFIRIQTTSSHLLGADLLTNERYLREATYTQFWTGGYVAIALVLSLITFLQAIRLRDLTHGLYGLLPLGLGLNTAGTEGLTAILFPATAHLFNDALVGASLMFSFGGLGYFAIRLFDTRRYHRWGHRYLQSTILLAIATFAASGSRWYGTFASPLLMFGLIFWLFLTWAALQMIRRGEDRIGRLFIAAFTLPMLGAAIGLSRYLGWLPQNEFTQYIVPATSMIHLVLMTLALSERLLEAESRFREASQRILLESEHRRDQEQLLAMISHEIRNPIAVIDAASQSLELLDPEAGPERSQRYRRIRRASGRLAMLLDLVTMRNPEKPAIEVLDYQPVEPAGLTGEIIRLLEQPLPARIVVEGPPEARPVQADRHLLRFAWLNLIENAGKYSPAGSPIHISIAMKRESGKDGLEWRIVNEGPGIAPGMEEKIFEKYERGAGNEQLPGCGLGLYLARYIVELHGGYLKTLPMEGGACFVSWLPCNPVNRPES